MLERLRRRRRNNKRQRANDAVPPQVNRLSAVPVANDAVEAQPHGERMVLWITIRKRWFNSPPFSWALPYRPKRGVGLDKLGREVFEAIDGQRNVEQIIEQFAQRHKLRFHEARQSVLQFLKMLVERKLIVIAVPEQTD